MSDKLYTVHRSKAAGGPIQVKESELNEGQLAQFKTELEEVFEKMPESVQEAFIEEKVSEEFAGSEDIIPEKDDEENPEEEPVDGIAPESVGKAEEEIPVKEEKPAPAPVTKGKGKKNVQKNSK